MGCSYCNRLSENINYYGIESIENDLQLSNIPSRILDNTFHRFSTDKTMTLVQFQRALRELNIEYDKYYLFYNFFIDQSLSTDNVILYNAQKLSTLGILLGNCSDQEKLTLLFQNYDNDARKVLS